MLSFWTRWHCACSKMKAVALVPKMKAGAFPTVSFLRVCPLFLLLPFTGFRLHIKWECGFEARRSETKRKGEREAVVVLTVR